MSITTRSSLQVCQRTLRAVGPRESKLGAACSLADLSILAVDGAANRVAHFLAAAGVQVDFELLLKQFKVAFLDYARFTLSDSTHKLTPEVVAHNAKEGRCIPHKRSVERLRWLLATTSEWLREWEAGELRWAST